MSWRILFLGLLVTSVALEWRDESNITWIESADELKQILDHTWQRQSDQGPPANLTLHLRSFPPPPPTGKGYQCDDDQVRLATPWDEKGSLFARVRMLEYASVLEQHPARAGIAHLVLSWTSAIENDEWRFPTRTNSPCWSSAAAQTSWTTWQAAKNQTRQMWFAASLVHLGTQWLEAARVAFEPLGLRRLVQLSAFPYFNPHWAQVAGLSTTTDDLGILPALLRVCAETKTDILLPGLDPGHVAQWSEAVELALDLGIPQIWTRLINNSPRTETQWSEIIALMNLYGVHGLVTTTLVESDLARLFFEPRTEQVKNPYSARKWTSVAIVVGSSSTSVSMTLADPSLRLPFQVMIPGSVLPAPVSWIRAHNWHTWLYANWSIPLFSFAATADQWQTLGCSSASLPLLPTNRTWLVWTGRIDCDYAPAPTVSIRVHFAVPRGQDEDFDLVVCDPLLTSKTRLFPFVLDVVDRRFLPC